MLALLVMTFVTGSMAADMDINIIVQPKVLVIASESEWLTIHTDIALSAVDTSSLAVNGLPVSWHKADAKGNLVAKFDVNEVKAMVAPGEVVFELTGLTNDGVSFSGTDTVCVK
jgi:deoxycytidine triphosphate deaminase